MTTSRLIRSAMLAAGLLGATLPVSAQDPDLPDIPDKICALCHDDVLPEEDEHQRYHKDLKCVECHTSLLTSDIMEEMEHEEELPPVDCTLCHQDQQKLLAASTHAAHFEGDLRPYPDCKSCHTVEHQPIARAARSPLELREEEISRCSACHEKDLASYHKSAHFLGHESGNLNAPSCVDCHSSHDVLNPENPASRVHEANVSESCERCHDNYRYSLHRKEGSPESSISCSFCHLGHTTDRESLVQHITGTGGANHCFVCHSGQHTDPKMAHHQLAIGPDGRPPETACTECHVFHWKVDNGDQLPGRPVSDCATCHEEQAAAYEMSAHSRSRVAGNIEPPTCITCHGETDVLDPDHQFDQAAIVELCSSCHADSELMISFGVNAHVVEGFEDTYHGKLYDLMNTGKHFAICTDCHGYHNVLEPEDPDSSVSQARIVETCRECHEEANENFISYLVHPVQNTDEESDRAAELAGNRPTAQLRAGNDGPQGRSGSQNGGFFGTLFLLATWFMKVLFVTVMSFFILHTVLWLQRGLRRKHAKPVVRYYRRFTGFERFLHILVNVSFLILAFTGLPQTFAHTSMGGWILEHVMTLETAQVLHYWAAAVTGLYFVLHLGQVFLNLRKKGWRTILMSPDSLVPQKKDLSDFIQHVKWFFGKAKQPKFDRWTYWEKFDYFAVFWGVFIIGASGLIRWKEEFFGNLLGGGLVSIATAVHEEEALLATAFIFIVHFFNTHLRAEKFPMDLSIYTGVISEHELHHERPAQLERLKAAGMLDKLEVHTRPVWAVALSAVWGMLALSIGLFLLALIVIGFASQGL